MSPTVRRLVLALAIGAGLLLALLFALPYVVSLDSARARILGAAESALHRKVEAGAIRLEIFSGLGAGLEKVAVKNGPGWQGPALLLADRFSVKVAFWPLLSRRIEIRKVVLEGATLAVERDEKGSWSTDGFLTAPASAGSGAPGPPAAGLLVSRLEVRRGRLSFADRKVAPGQTMTTSLDDFAGEVAGL